MWALSTFDGLNTITLARIDRHLDAGLRVAADALALAADDEGAERGQLHGLAGSQAVADLRQHPLDEFGRFRPREADLLVDRLAQIRSRYSFACHHAPPAFGF